MAETPVNSVRDGRAARVTDTGIALVHAGELILPRAGSEAQAEQVGASDRTAVHYHFPIEVQVVGAVGQAAMDRLADQIFAKFMHAANSLNTG
jgi:hypothetical protein